MKSTVSEENILNLDSVKFSIKWHILNCSKLLSLPIVLFGRALKNTRQPRGELRVSFGFSDDE